MSAEINSYKSFLNGSTRFFQVPVLFTAIDRNIPVTLSFSLNAIYFVYMPNYGRYASNLFRCLLRVMSLPKKA